MAGNVKRHNPYSPESVEGVWVRTQRDNGVKKGHIIENVLLKGCFGSDPTHVSLIVEYQLGERPYSDIEHLLKPDQPIEFELLAETIEGYLCAAIGHDSEMFHVLVKAPSVPVDVLIQLIEDHQSELCFLAFKHVHEGLPFAYTLNGEKRTADAGISYEEITKFVR